MPARLAPHESCLPPPRQPCRASPAASLVLYDGDVLVAWIAGRSLGFGGFPDERAAADAALVAYGALARWVSHGRHPAPPVPEAARLDISADAPEGERWVLADGLPIAQLVDPRSVRVDRRAADVPDTRPGTSDRPRGDAGSEMRDAHAGFEIPVPLPVGELRLRTAAYAAYRALCRARLPWRLWNAGSHARRVGAARPERVTPAAADRLPNHGQHGAGHGPRTGSPLPDHGRDDGGTMAHDGADRAAARAPQRGADGRGDADLGVVDRAASSRVDR
jgi:hypothetical protein